MKIAMTNTQVRVTFLKDEAEKLNNKIGEGPFFFHWNDREHNLTLLKSGPNDPKSMLRSDHPADPKSEAVVAWARRSLPHGGRRLPTFGAVEVKEYKYVDNTLVLTPPPENMRPKVKKMSPFTRGKPKEVAPEPVVTVVPPAAGVLETVRHHLKELNACKEREPGLSFKLKSDGTLGFEFISDE